MPEKKSENRTANKTASVHISVNSEGRVIAHDDSTALWRETKSVYVWPGMAATRLIARENHLVKLCSSQNI